MSTQRRLERLERRVVSTTGEPDESVLFVVLVGFAPPKACEDGLLARDRRERPGLAWRWLDLTDAEGRCAYCGQSHRSDGEPRAEGRVVARLGNVSTRDV